MRFALVRCSIDRARLAQSDEGYGRAFGDEPFECVVIRDARSLAEAYNRALARVRAPLVILSHDDAWPVSPGAIDRVAAHLAEVDIVGIAGADLAMSSAWMHAGAPHLHGHVLCPAANGEVNAYFWGAERALVTGIRLLDGCFIAARTGVARAVGFDAERFDGFHGYDADFCWRASASGRTLGVAADVSVFHASGGDFGADWARYDARFVDAHRGALDRGPSGSLRKAAARFPSVEAAVSAIGPGMHAEIARRLRG